MTDQQDMNQFMDEIDKSMVTLEKGEILKGTVVKVGEEDVLVNIGHMSDGVIPKTEISHESGLLPSDVLSEGDEITVCVLKVQDDEGQVLLSKKRADQIVVWDELSEAFSSGAPVEITVKEAVKGGVVTYVKGVRAFVPASQLALGYVEDLTTFVGKTMETKIIDLNKEKKNVVLSRKAIEQEERAEAQEKLWETLSSGDVIKGEVKRLEKFGAFIDVGGIDGLAHVSALSWRRVKHPEEVVSIGDEVEVEVLDVQKDKNRLSLKVLNAQENPWDDISKHHKANDVTKGKVVRLTDFGAFIQLDSGIEGLVHVSEISSDHVKHPKDVLEAGQEVDVRILGIKPSEHRMSLSIKAVKGEQTASQEVVESFSNEGDASVTLGDMFADKLNDFFKK